MRAEQEQATAKERVVAELSALKPTAHQDGTSWAVRVTRADGTQASLGVGSTAGLAWSQAAMRLKDHGAAVLLRIGGFAEGAR